MLHRLPAELALEILRAAAETFITSDRRTVVHLALTGSLIYDLVSPVLYQRLVVRASHSHKLAAVFNNKRICTHIRELAITDSDWRPPPSASNLVGLRSLTGQSGPIALFLETLPCGHPALARLRTVQLWNDVVLRGVPPTVTRVCLWLWQIGDPQLQALVDWLESAPSVTQIACELVEHDEHRMKIVPERLVEALYAVLDAGGSRLENLSVRMAGNAAEDPQWTAFLVALRQYGKVDPRIRLWRDRRRIWDFEDDAKTSTDDSFVGRDIWSEARPAIHCY